MATIKHLFVLMQENRSFDHLLGYSGIVGVDARTGADTAVDGLTQAGGTNTDPRTGQEYSTSPTATYTMQAPDVEHGFLDVLEQLCGRDRVPPDGRLPDATYPPIDMSGFVSNFVAKVPTADPATPMRCFAPSQLPVLTTLAREFAICDHWFASHPGPTWPNRFFVHGASPSETGSADSPPPLDIAKAMLGIDRFRFAHGTIYDRLFEAGRTHAVYQGNNCPQVRSITTSDAGNAIHRIPFSSFAHDLHDPAFDRSYIFIEPDYGTSGIAGLVADCDSHEQNDMHPPSDVRQGEQLIKQVYEAIRNSPVWEQSVFLLLFDEHGGFFDHVPPPPAAAPGDGAIDHRHGFRFDRSGVRVPALVISPWVGRNVVDHTTYDHTSVLSTLERLFELEGLTQRDGAANDVLHLFSEPQPRTDTPSTLG